MSINPEEAAHLRETRRELVEQREQLDPELTEQREQREQLDREIAQLDSYLQGEGGEPPTADPDPVKAEVINPQHI